MEAIVAERTRELVAEKARTELLISQMLPKKVAEDLKHGKTVEPEAFECVTIYFRCVCVFIPPANLRGYIVILMSIRPSVPPNL